MRPIWVLSAPNGPHVGPMNLAIRVITEINDDPVSLRSICYTRPNGLMKARSISCTQVVHNLRAECYFVLIRYRGKQHCTAFTDNMITPVIFHTGSAHLRPLAMDWHAGHARNRAWYYGFLLSNAEWFPIIWLDFLNFVEVNKIESYSEPMQQ